MVVQVVNCKNSGMVKICWKSEVQVVNDSRNVVEIWLQL